MQKSYIYMSGALTGLGEDDLKYASEIYNRVEDLCKALGIDAYLPGKSPTTPSKGIPHHKVWKIDYEKVSASLAVVAYVGLPSTGVGAEIEMARQAEVPVVLLCEENRQDAVSRLVLGNPRIVDIVPFTTIDEMEAKLRPILVQVISEVNLDKAAEEGWAYSEVKELRRSSLVAARDRYMPISVDEWKQIWLDRQRKALL
ncbi:2'-deoxynucleoside 5'-phosphate N-hydrolase 1 [subsurface metagenome]